ncbi:SET domain-containing protein [Peniophora sp. CONT]|nr:SET domain-containing protein [Peniophora sp. CONT]
MEDLVRWFEERGGTFDASALRFSPIDGLGRGAVAVRDLDKGHVLFTIPRNLTLSLRTSSLPGRFGISAWKEHQLHVGWAGLILCMMWEEALGEESPWSVYLDSLPNSFDTPMFWSTEELAELAGTAVVDKIGKDQAERDFTDRVLPAIQSRPDLFPPQKMHRYTVHNYHVMGSRILSRSFTVEKWEGENLGSPAASAAADAMDVDEEDSTGERPIVNQNTAESGVGTAPVDEDDDSDDEDDPANVAMVPMADMLNARFECENAKLFYEERDLRMATTQPIKKGEQIWNTYGDPPNSDLLRRYGHVDRVPLPDGSLGNPADIVELRADLVLASVTSTDLGDRVDWWLEEGGDDVFIFDKSATLPEDFISFTRLLSLPQPEWEKVKKKGKLPKPKMDEGIADIAEQTLQRRLAQYPTTLEEDEAMLHDAQFTTHKYHALVVRMGEKHLLVQALRHLQASKARVPRKRKAEDMPGKHSSKKR